MATQTKAIELYFPVILSCATLKTMVEQLIILCCGKIVEYLKNNNKQYRPLTWIHVGFKNLLHGTLMFQGCADREYDSKKTQTKRR